MGYLVSRNTWNVTGDPIGRPVEAQLAPSDSHIHGRTLLYLISHGLKEKDIEETKLECLDKATVSCMFGHFTCLGVGAFVFWESAVIKRSTMRGLVVAEGDGLCELVLR